MSAARKLCVEAFRQVAADHPLWSHPFLQLCKRERLGTAEVRAVATQMYKFSREFNRILANILAHCPDEASRVVIAENLFEELGEGDPAQTHPELLRRFTRAVGIPDAVLESRPEEPETAAMIETYLRLPERHGYLAALGAVCFASEGIVSTLYAQLQRGIRGAAPIPKEAMIFFDVHVVTDVGHAARLAAVVEASTTTERDMVGIAGAVREAMDARLRFFDGVMRMARPLSIAPRPSARGPSLREACAESE